MRHWPGDWSGKTRSDKKPGSGLPQSVAEEYELVIGSWMQPAGWPLRWFGGQSDYPPGPQTSLGLVAVQQLRISDPVVKARWNW